MFKHITLTALAAATAMTAVPAAADAQPRGGYYNDGYSSQSYRGEYRGDRQYRGDRRYNSRSGRYYSRNNGYYGRSNGYYGQRCRDKGTTGTIVGAIAGGLLGREIAKGDGYRSRRNDGTAGMIIGGAVGALAGRAIDRDC
jgi:hypothetical protein